MDEKGSDGLVLPCGFRRSCEVWLRSQEMVRSCGVCLRSQVPFCEEMVGRQKEKCIESPAKNLVLLPLMFI